MSGPLECVHIVAVASEDDAITGTLVFLSQAVVACESKFKTKLKEKRCGGEADCRTAPWSLIHWRVVEFFLRTRVCKSLILAVAIKV